MQSGFWGWLGGAFHSAFGEMQALSVWEGIAVVLALAYLLLAMKRNRLCWVAAFASTAIYTVLFYEVALLMESALNVYYMAMAVYGYWLWHADEDPSLRVESWPLARHVLIIGVTAVVSLLAGYLMATYTQASFPYLDAATTCFAVMTTYLVAKKVLENWLYWVVIDVVSIYLYLSKGLMMTSLLFVLYVGLAVAGYFVWRAAMAEQREPRLALESQ